MSPGAAQNAQSLHEVHRCGLLPVPQHCQRQGLLLLRRAKLKELLDDVVAEHVCHETVGGRQDLIEHHLLLRLSGALQFLLDKPKGQRK